MAKKEVDIVDVRNAIRSGKLEVIIEHKYNRREIFLKDTVSEEVVLLHTEENTDEIY